MNTAVTKTEILLPHFLGIGAIKCATTWLHRHFFKHPDVFVPIKKPLQFFDKHYHHGVEAYGNIFKNQSNKLRGELSSSYSTLDGSRIKDIQSLIPDVKLLYVMRHPIFRDWSDMRMEATLFEGKTLNEITLDDWIRLANSDKIKAQGNYLTQLQNWMGVFDRSQFWIGIFESMIKNPEEIVTQVFEFLHVQSPKDWAPYQLHEKVFEGPEASIPEDILELLTKRHNQKSIDQLSEFLNMDLNKIWKI